MVQNKSKAKGSPIPDVSAEEMNKPDDHKPWPPASQPRPLPVHDMNGGDLHMDDLPEGKTKFDKEPVKAKAVAKVEAALPPAPGSEKVEKEAKPQAALVQLKVVNYTEELG